jgi:RNA polymerase sigma factor (sigma-70 family)
MPKPDDITLLRQYAGGDEAAFTTLFERHVHLVYSAALRQARNPSHAEEVTQAVFILLARKAKSLSPKTVLSGWLYQAARLTTAGLIKRESRRQRREQEMYMQSLTEPDTSLWEQISPLLDEAMGRLNEKDRDAIILRFFENKTPQETAAGLKLNEVTARKRVSRALEKLRRLFAKRGVVLTAAVIAGTISGNSVQAAPAALAHSATAVTIAKGATASTSTLTLVKGTLKFMALSKVKTTVVTAAAVLLTAGGTGLVTYKYNPIHALRAAFYPNIQGAWEGTMPLGGIGITKGQSTDTRVVVKLSKSSGDYVATLDALDLGRTNLPVAKVVYDFPNLQLSFYPRRNVVYQGKVNAGARGMVFNGLTLRRTDTPSPSAAPLDESDFAPRAGSVMQGYWQGGIVLEGGHYPDGLGDRQLGNNWKGEPMAASTILPLDLKIAEDSAGTFRAELDSPMQGADGQPASLMYGQGTVNLEIKSKAGRFQGVLDLAGDEMSGSWTQGGKSLPAFFKRADYQAEAGPTAAEDYSFTSASDLPGHWKGAWSAAAGTINVTIPLTLDIGKLPDGSYRATLANLEQLGNESPIPATDFEYSPPKLHLEWKWAGGVYDGTLENGKLVGTWKQGGGGFPLVFEREK